MDAINSFKGYGKVDELEQRAFKKETRKRLIIISISAVLLIALVIGVVAGAVIHNKNTSGSEDVPATPNYEAIKALCSVTRYPDSCYSSLDSANSTDPERIFLFSLTVVQDSLERASIFTDDYANKTDDPAVKEALFVCATVLGDAISSLNDSISSMQNGGNKLISDVSSIYDLKTWLSTVITYQETCFDSLYETNATFVEDVKLLMKNLTENASNSLAIVSKLVSLLGDLEIPIHRRRLLAVEEDSGFPEWVSAAHMTNQIKRRNVSNLTYENFSGGVAGNGFIARDIGFMNTAGAAKHQAVAFQKCNILLRQPMPNQFVTLTAQGKTDPNQNTGISIQRCTMGPFDKLTASAYLGRPWKDYSTTIVMQSNIGGFLSPLGWSPWVQNVVPPSTIFYAEYQNTGRGSSTNGRVTWAGYKPSLTAAQAAKYNVQSFTKGGSWLPATSVTFDST
ncbi:pectinesterase 3 [Dorcoceras hygrometricum]|uniref:Pectinesterase 3 n=1 Tax=Dorcoceras hygrometricum TaxID=472368 RepID=A0A2Z7CYK3_9LAMI|nr:pectinesterase 3 [Dorcoceras hygrometricum]